MAITKTLTQVIAKGAAVKFKEATVNAGAETDIGYTKDGWTVKAEPIMVPLEKGLQKCVGFEWTIEGDIAQWDDTVIAMIETSWAVVTPDIVFVPATGAKVTFAAFTIMPGLNLTFTQKDVMGMHIKAVRTSATIDEVVTNT